MRIPNIITTSTKDTMEILDCICTDIVNGHFYDIYVDFNNNVLEKHNGTYAFSKIGTKIKDKLDYLADKIYVDHDEKTGIVHYSYTSLSDEGEEFLRLMDILCR